ncbi:MAG: transcriptional regulator NrdR [Acidimicrobiia bacterium]
MRCPYCADEDTRVIDSRPAGEGREVRRRRACPACGQRFTTYERAQLPLLVRKRDGTTDPFVLDKVRSGIERALGGRDVAVGVVEDIVAQVEVTAQAAAPEIASEEIGRIVLDGLKQADEVAYLRFASVYKDFQGAQDFEKEMATLDD